MNKDVKPPRMMYTRCGLLMASCSHAMFAVLLAVDLHEVVRPVCTSMYKYIQYMSGYSDGHFFLRSAVLSPVASSSFTKIVMCSSQHSGCGRRIGGRLAGQTVTSRGTVVNHEGQIAIHRW